MWVTKERLERIDEDEEIMEKLLNSKFSDFFFQLSRLQESASQQEWIWDMFYNAGYLSIAGALFWYNRYLVLTKNT